jgi:hypothetical protein
MGKKCALDKFYTKDYIAINLIRFINLNKYDLIIEPSAGGGSFSRNIDSDKLLAFDLLPESKEIIKKDWFDYKIPEDNKNVLIIGNPPFGTRNDLSKAFIQHGVSFKNVTTIAFVLPNVFKKHTNQKVIPKGWRLAKIVEIEKNGFTLNGEDYNVPCSFFIWTKEKGINDFSFDVKKYKTHPDFDFVKMEEADFYIMGASPKTVKQISEVNPNNRGYYIKSNIDINILKEEFKNIDWAFHGNSSANGGVSWYSMPEIIKTYEDNKRL